MGWDGMLCDAIRCDRMQQDAMGCDGMAHEKDLEDPGQRVLTQIPAGIWKWVVD